jgi:hypothetical protein
VADNLAIHCPDKVWRIPSVRGRLACRPGTTPTPGPEGQEPWFLTAWLLALFAGDDTGTAAVNHKSEVRFQSVKVAIGVEQRKAVQDAEGSYDNVDRLSNRYSALPQEAVVSGRLDRDGLAHQGAELTALEK